MAYTFGDSFDLYAAVADAGAGYWDNAATQFSLITPGRFIGSQALAPANGFFWFKNSPANDAVHHIVCAIRQTSAITGSTAANNIQLSDGATAQCSIVFRSDGAILLQSGAPGGTTLATYTGAITLQNQWFAFEFEVVINNTTGSFTVRKNGNTSNDFTLGSLNTRGGTANNYANRLSLSTQSAATGHQFDDLLWRSDASAVPWVGDVRTYVRMPASDASKQFTASAAAFPQLIYSASSTQAFQSGTARYTPFIASVTGAVGSITLPVTTASTANTKCSIFSDASGLPGTALGSATPVSAPSVGTATFTFGTPVSVTAGTRYWVGSDSDAASGAYSVNTNFSTAYTLAVAYASFPTNNPAVSVTASPAAFTVNITQSSNYPFLMEAQQDGATTYVYDSNVGDADFYGIGSIGVTPASVVAVTTRGFIQKSDAGSRSGAVQLKSGSTTVQSTPGPVSTTFAWMWRTDVTDPATGAAWTPTGVNNAQIGPTVTA